MAAGGTGAGCGSKMARKKEKKCVNRGGFEPPAPGSGGTKCTGFAV